MKYIHWLVLATLLFCLGGCVPRNDIPTEQTDPTETSLTTEATESTPPTDPPPSTEAPTEPRIGWYEENGETWYYDETGTMCTGWQEIDGLRYYFREDGTMARGKVIIDGTATFFTSAGQTILLVNPWYSVPSGYEPDLVEMPSSLSTSGNNKVDRSCYDALIQMLTDCNKECPKACAVSCYRSYDYQVKLFNRKVNFYLNQGYEKAEAEKLAATVVAVPGTSEHHTGLAIDIVDTRSWDLEESQADLPAQKWLMENAWKYGFILRYPADKTEITGIIYEPWHYRYVGTAVAAELHASGQTLEEYIDALTR